MIGKLTREQATEKKQLEALFSLKVGHELSFEDISNIKRMARRALAAAHKDETLKRLAQILSGSDAPGELRSLTVTAQSYVDRCRRLAKERDAHRDGQPTLPVAVRWKWSDVSASWTYAPADKINELVAAGFCKSNGVDVERLFNEPPAPAGEWISVNDLMPADDADRRVCVYTPSSHADMRYRLVPADLFRKVCTDATHWHYMTPPA